MISRFITRRRNDLKKITRWIHSLAACREQDRRASEMSLASARNLVIFMTATIDDCNGGILSIASLAATSRKLLPEYRVLLSTYPGEPTLAKNRTFPNDESIIRLSLISRLTRPQKLVIHVPEMDADGFYKMLSPVQREWIRAVPDCQINILNQNIDYMRTREQWSDLYRLASNITQSTAHKRYTTQEVCDRYGIPLHRFGFYLDESLWPYRDFEQKEKLIVISPDENEYKSRVLKMMADELPDYQVVEVKRMAFSAYLDLISRAPFVVTFGEGEDGYFIQPPSVGSLGFAVYNERFFKGPEMKGLANVYLSFDELIERFPKDVRLYEHDHVRYEEVRRRHIALRDSFSYETYCDNLRRFYARQYDFLPSAS